MHAFNPSTWETEHEELCKLVHIASSRSAKTIWENLVLNKHMQMYLFLLYFIFY